MTWRGQPSIRGGGNLSKESRGDHYANPPSSPGLRGLALGKDPYAQKRDGVVSTATFMSRKGEPFR